MEVDDDGDHHGEGFGAVRGKNWRKLRESLEMLLSLSEDM